MYFGQALLIIAVLTTISTSAYGCGRPEAITPPSAATATPTPINLQSLLAQSGRAMESLESFHFRLEHKAGGTPILPILVIDSAEGDVVKPDKVSSEFSGLFGQLVIKSSQITVGPSTYITNPLSGQWEHVPVEISPMGFFNPSRGIADVMSRIEQPSLLRHTQKMYRISGTLPAEALTSLFGATTKETRVAVELSIDARSLYLLEATINGRVTPTEPDGTIRIITFSRFNQPASIASPL